MVSKKKVFGLENKRNAAKGLFGLENKRNAAKGFIMNNSTFFYVHFSMICAKFCLIVMCRYRIVIIMLNGYCSWSAKTGDLHSQSQ